jgi:hypothetical protein
MKLVVLIIILTGIAANQNIYSIELRDKSENGNILSSIVYFSIGLITGAGATDFFDVYRSTLGGRENKFALSPMLGAGTKFDLIKGCRLGLSFSYNKAKLLDSYFVQDSGTEIVRGFNQNMIVDQMPLLLTFEIIPYNIQFRSYAGFGVGAMLNHIYWREDVSTPVINDKRKGGVYFDDDIIAPVLKAYTGIEMGFDKKNFESILGSLIFEVSYIYSFSEVEIFKSIARQFYATSESLQTKFDILNGYFLFNIALSFNFNFRMMKR